MAADAELPCLAIPETEPSGSHTTIISGNSNIPEQTEPGSSTTSKANKKRKMRNVAESRADILMAKAINELEKMDNLPSNKHSAFASSIANELSEMDNKQVIIAKKLINDIISMGQLNLLKDKYVTENPIVSDIKHAS